MIPLDKVYQDKLNSIFNSIQESESLTVYLENEEDEDYAVLQQEFEPQVAELYNEVAENDPLELLAFEKALMDERGEGLFLPKVLGYSVIRGEINERVKYAKPQEHFEELLLAICNSTNFDILKKRTGQTMQLGFALSSDIWVTNVLNQVKSKRVLSFMHQLIDSKYRNEKLRNSLLVKYRSQFIGDTYQTAEFPTSLAQLKSDFRVLKDFLYYRITKGKNNESITESLKELVFTKDFFGLQEHFEFMIIYAMYFPQNKEDTTALIKLFDSLIDSDPGFNDRYLEFLIRIQNSALEVNIEHDSKMTKFCSSSKLLKDYFACVNNIHKNGIFDEKAIIETKKFYNSHEGRSQVNKAVRNTIFSYIQKIVSNLTTEEFHDWFELSKIYPSYLEIFDNQKFSQAVRKLNMRYVKKLIRTYTDKRGKDYQSIKKFVSSFFVEIGFLDKKKAIELFKTKRVVVKDKK